MKRRRSYLRRLADCLPAAIGIAAMLMLAVGVPARAQAPGANSAGALIRDGIDAYQQGKYHDAVDKLTQAVKLVSDNSAVVLYLGLSYLRQDQLNEAIAVWQNYVRLPPTTETERDNHLQARVNRYLTLLVREENHRIARQQIEREHELGPAAGDVVAITYYRNLGSPEFAPLQKGLTALLTDDVSHVKGLKVVDRDRMQALLDELKLGSSGLADKSTVARTGRLLGAGRIAAGSYLDTDHQRDMRVDSLLAATSSGKVLSNQQASGELAQFYEIEKRLARQMLNDLGYDQAKLKSEGVLDAIQKPATTNYKAFQAFSRGLDAKDHQYYYLTRTLCHQALQYDPNFKLAQLELCYTPMVARTLAGVADRVSAEAPTVDEILAGFSVHPKPPANSLPDLPPLGIVPPPPPALPPPPPPLPPPSTG